MKKVEDISEVNSLISSFMKKGILSNNYIMPDKYSTYIREALLYYEKAEASLVLFVDCHTYWRVYYYIKDCNADIQLPEDKPSVMEIVCERKSESYKNALEYWVLKGFEPYIHRSRMSAKPQALHTEQQDVHNLSFASHNNASIIQAMLSDNFDQYLGCVPSVSEVERYVDNREIIVAKDESEQIIGLLHTGYRNSTCFIWHLLVLPEARGKGIARKLFTYFYSDLPNLDKIKIQLWVKNDNIVARSLYESLGFTYDGWESTGLIRKNRFPI